MDTLIFILILLHYIRSFNEYEQDKLSTHVKTLLLL